MKLISAFKHRLSQILANQFQRPSLPQTARRSISSDLFPPKQDYLGPAAVAGHNASAAVKAGEYDKAWGFYSEQKSLYTQHANQCGMTAQQVIALDASVHMNMANVLRLEGRHKEALTHATYSVKGAGPRASKSQILKLRAYLNRCRLKNTSLDEVMAYVKEANGLANFRSIQADVEAWVSKG